MLFFSINQAIGWIDNSTDQIAYVSGSAVYWPYDLTLSFNDGLLPEVLFSAYTFDMEFVTRDILLIADKINNVVRIVDLVTSSVTSICERRVTSPG